MRPFAYTRHTQAPQAVAEATRSPRIVFLAGGTNLLDYWKLGVVEPDEVVDINALPLATLEAGPEGLIIGAMVRNSELAAHPAVLERFPMLSEALLSGASPQLRNMATLGGNLLQRTRCPYFRDTTFACNKRAPGTGCAAIAGCHRQHAILGTSDACIATHPSDMAVALTALDAIVETLGPDGPRRIPLIDFYLEPGPTPNLENMLVPSELITGVRVPDLPFARHSCYVKVRDRSEFDFALASVACALEVQDGVIRQVRLALGGVATRPWRARVAEGILVDQAPSVALFERAADAELSSARPRAENAFKVPLASRTMVRALVKLCREKGIQP